MEPLNNILLFTHEHRFIIMSIMLFSFLGFIYWLFPKIEKKLSENKKTIEEKEETLSGARVHYKDLLIEVKSLRIEKKKTYRRK